ncbi:MAG TPA: substrate-binding domain-containing protein [Mycobacteriales bacterium]|nr:substrate-binding domain-containing protein [Mycobacteriales bacterium]
MVNPGRHRRDTGEEVPWYESRRVVGRRPGWIGPAAVGTGSILLVVGALLIGSSFVPAKLAGHTGCAGPRTTATVAASPDQAPVLQRLAALWSLTEPRVGAACASVAVVAAESAAVASTLGTDAPSGKPDVWAPESAVWAGLAAPRPEAAAALPRTGPSLATTPVVMAVARDRARALGWPAQKLSWQAVLAGMAQDPTWGRYGHRNWGPFVIGMGDPTRSTAALHTLLAVTDVDRDGAVEPEEIPNELALERSVGLYATDAQLAERTGGKGPVSAFPATEQQVLEHNAGGEVAQLVPVYPADGVAAADHPYLTLRGTWVTGPKKQVAQAFADYVLGPEGRAAYGKAGFRDKAAAIPAATAGNGTVAPAYRTRTLPAAAQTAQALVRWRALRRPANVLAAIDTSGSMAELAPGLPVTKLAVFQKAAAGSVRLFNARSRLALWEFSSLLDGPRDYKQLVPGRPLGTRVGPVDQRALIIGAADQMHAVGSTGLYDTIDAGYREVQRTWRADQQNILVVMTDGKNEDAAGLALPQLVSSLRAHANPKKPITAIFIAYGADADVTALNQAATAVRGRTYWAQQPTDIGKVFLAAMVNR